MQSASNSFFRCGHHGYNTGAQKYMIENKTVPLIIGASGLAIAVNVYRMINSHGFPLIFTRGLTLFKLSTVDYYAYLLLYCIVYVIPLAALVLIFAVSLGTRKTQARHGKFLTLVSGFMMFGLGVRPRPAEQHHDRGWALDTGPDGGCYRRFFNEKRDTERRRKRRGRLRVMRPTPHFPDACAGCLLRTCRPALPENP